MTETLELSYPVTEDEVRDFLRQTSAPERYEGESGEAQLKADLEQTMQAVASRQQWLQGLDPLTRMEAERQPIISGLIYESPGQPASAEPSGQIPQPDTPANTGGTEGTDTPDNTGQGQPQPQPPNEPPQPGSTGL